MDQNIHNHEYLEAPLEGLTTKPLHEMTESELRERVLKLHEYRMSSQALRGAMGRVSQAKAKAQEQEEKLNEMFGEF